MITLTLGFICMDMNCLQEDALTRSENLLLMSSRRALIRYRRSSGSKKRRLKKRKKNGTKIREL